MLCETQNHVLGVLHRKLTIMKDYLKQNYVISRFKKQYNGRVLKTFSAQLENMVNNIYNQVTR